MPTASDIWAIQLFLPWFTGWFTFFFGLRIFSTEWTGFEVNAPQTGAVYLVFAAAGMVRKHVVGFTWDATCTFVFSCSKKWSGSDGLIAYRVCSLCVWLRLQHSNHWRCMHEDISLSPRSENNRMTSKRENKWSGTCHEMGITADTGLPQFERKRSVVFVPPQWVFAVNFLKSAVWMGRASKLTGLTLWRPWTWSRDFARAMQEISLRDGYWPYNFWKMDVWYKITKTWKICAFAVNRGFMSSLGEIHLRLWNII